MGMLKGVKASLDENANLDPNWPDKFSCALYVACLKGFHGVTIALLHHPHTDVHFGYEEACANGQASIVKLLLHDPRCAGKLSVWSASRHGHAAVLKWVIASGRDVDLHERRRNDEWEGEEEEEEDEEEYEEEEYTATKIARKKGKIETASLLERFQSDPDQTRQAIRQELGVTGGSFFLFFLLFFLYYYYNFLSFFLSFLLSSLFSS